MIDRIKKRVAGIFLNPEYTREDRARFAGFVKPLLYLFMLLSFFLVVILFSLNIYRGVVIEGIIFLCFLAAFVVYRKGKTNVSALMVLSILVASFLASLLFGRETYYVAAFLFPLVLLLGSIFLTRKMYALTVIFSIVLFIGASFESDSRYHFYTGTYYPFINIFIAFVLILVSMVIINLFTGMLYRIFRTAKENEEKFNVISEKLKVGIYAFSSSGKFVYVNEFMCSLLGYSKSELLSMNYIDFVYSEDKTLVLERGERRLAGEDVVNGYEIRILRKDGSPLWVFLSAAKVDVAEKQLGVGALFTIQQKKNLERQILAEREQLAITLRSIDEGVIVTDLDGIMTMLNRAACLLAGVEREEVTGRHINTLFPLIEIDGEKKDAFYDLLKKYAHEGNRFFEGLFETGKRGDQKYLSVSLVLLRNAQSEQKGYVIVFKDITEAKKIEKNAERMDRLEALSLLAGGIAHDFNNILTGIMGNIDLLSLYLKNNNDDRVINRLEDAKKASSRAVELTRQLLAFSKGGSPVKDVTSLPSLVEDTISFILTGSNVTYSVFYPDDLWFVEVDHSQISQVIQNLVINAKQAMEAKGGKITVSLGNFSLQSDKIISGVMIPEGKYVKVTFADNGPGILPDILSKIFDPYFTTKETGNGLGLATVYSIIKQHGGYIGVESAINKGTAFHIYLAATEEGKVPVFGESKNSEKQQEFLSGRKSVLVMDDEELVRSITEEMLAELDFSAVLVSDGVECVVEYKKRFFENNPFNAVLLDLTIPGGVGGREAAAEILKINPEAYLIAMSGYTHNVNRVNSDVYGFSSVLQKPFLLEELRRCLNNL